MHSDLVHTFLVDWFFPNIHLVKLLYCSNDGVRYSGSHCFYLMFVTFSQSFLLNCSVGIFPQLSSYTSKLSFMPYEQVGEQNQKIL